MAERQIDREAAISQCFADSAARFASEQTLFALMVSASEWNLCGPAQLSVLSERIDIGVHMCCQKSDARHDATR